MKTKFGVDKEKLESTMERTFDAPRELVWKAHTDPELIAKWWGPRKYEISVEKFDAKEGGEWKIVHTAEGERHVFFGEFRQVKEPLIIIWTFNYEPYPGNTVVETINFEELPDGKTRAFVVSKYPSIEALEGMMQSGMEEGANETWDRLEELLEKKDE